MGTELLTFALGGLDLDELQRLADAAIEGPWEAVYEEDWHEVSIRIAGEPRGFYTEVCKTGQWPRALETSPTAEFIVAARMAIPRLIAALRALDAAGEGTVIPGDGTLPSST